MVYRRRKGVAIVETNKGILLVATKRKKFMLPGGGAEKWETRKKAAIRELYEETGLKTKRIKYLFRYVGNNYYGSNGRLTRNYGKVFLVEAIGQPRPGSEIKYIDFFKAGKKINLHDRTIKVIEKYLSNYKNESNK